MNDVKRWMVAFEEHERRVAAKTSHGRYLAVALVRMKQAVECLQREVLEMSQCL